MNLLNDQFRLGRDLLARGNDAEALRAFHRCVILSPKSDGPWLNLGIALRNLGRYEQALQASLTAAKLAKPGSFSHAEARNNIGVILLTLGRWKEGWEHYEHRLGVPLFQIELRCPVWQGEDLAGKTLLVRPEQGYGDTLWAMRYIPALKDLVLAQGGTLAFETWDKMLSLVRGQPWAEGIIFQAKDLRIDYELPMLSLPHRLKTYTEADIPPNRLQAISEEPRLPEGDGLKIGFTFSGNPFYIRTKHRDLAPEKLRPLFALPGTSWYNFHQEIDLVGVHNVRHLTKTWADTAALVSQLDLVVSVDTSFAHLAAALGKTTHVLLPAVPDFRWMLDRSDTPWYPSLTLHRQPLLDDWTLPLQEVAHAIAHQTNESSRCLREAAAHRGGREGSAPAV